MVKSAWNVSTVNILSALNKAPVVDGVLVDDLKYTVLDDSKVSYHGAQVLAELHLINDKLLPKEYVAYRPERLALHETIVAVSTTLKLQDEDEMQTTCGEVYQQVLSHLDELALDTLRENVMEDTTHLVEAYLRGEDISDKKDAARIEAICKQVEASNANFGEFKLGYTTEQAMITRATDVLFTEKANALIEPLVAREIAKNEQLNLLEPPRPSDRLTLMVAGGQASGKGSSVERLKQVTAKSGIDWRNIVKINTDSYKSLLLKPGTVRPELYSQLAQEEASGVHQKTQARLVDMANRGEAPHVFVDQVFVGKDKIDFGLMDGGRVIGMIVSTEVDAAVERSFARGIEAGDEGRYENTKGILRCHKLMAEQVPATLALYVGEKASFLLFDNNVPKGEQAGLVMSVNLREKEVKIYSQINLERFAQKSQIDIEATSRESLYVDVDSKSTDLKSDYLAPLIGEDVCSITRSSLSSESPNSYERKILMTSRSDIAGLGEKPRNDFGG